MASTGQAVSPRAMAAVWHSLSVSIMPLWRRVPLAVARGVMTRYIFPNAVSTLVVIATLYIATAIRTEAGLYKNISARSRILNLQLYRYDSLGYGNGRAERTPPFGTPQRDRPVQPAQRPSRAEKIVCPLRRRIATRGRRWNALQHRRTSRRHLDGLTDTRVSVRFTDLSVANGLKRLLRAAGFSSMRSSLRRLGRVARFDAACFCSPPEALAASLDGVSRQKITRKKPRWTIAVGRCLRTLYEYHRPTSLESAGPSERAGP
jgi:hypothetical protein